MSPRSKTRPLYFWCCVPNSAFFKWQMSISEAKWTFAPFVLAPSITSFLLLTFVRSHAGIFSNFSNSLSTTAFATGILMAWSIGINLCTKFLCCRNCHPFLQYVPHDNSVEILPYAVLWIHWFQGCTQALTWNHWSCCGSHHACFSCLSCKAWQEPLEFPISCEHSEWFLWIPCPRGQWSKYLVIF